MKKFDNFCKALSNLREGLQLEEPYSVVERTGIIGLFEICFEQAWKLMKAVLEEHGRTIDRVGSPKVVIQLAYQSGFFSCSLTFARYPAGVSSEPQEAAAMINVSR